MTSITISQMKIKNNLLTKKKQCQNLKSKLKQDFMKNSII